RDEGHGPDRAVTADPDGRTGPGVRDNQTPGSFRMSRLAILALLLLPATLAARAPDRPFDPDAAARAIAPFVDDRVFVVGHLDLPRLDVDALATWFVGLMKVKPDGVPGELITLKKALADAVPALTKAGAKDVFLILGSEVAPGDVPFVVLPLEDGADGKA